MGDEGSAAPGTGAMPDFERASYAATGAGAGASACAACQGPLPGEYFQVNGRVVCPSCRAQLGTGDTSGLSSRERFIMALVYGGGAALLGSLVWYLVARITGMELGLIAIGVGLLVGVAVRKGSRGRGGRGYQVMAVILTYLSIVTSYVPMVLKGIAENSEKQQAETATAGGKTAADDSAGGDAKPAAAPAPAEPPKKWNHGALVSLLALAGIVLGIAIAAPFLAGASNFMGWLIIAIALWEAWKINRRVEPQILGPFRLAPVAVQDAPPPPTAP